MPLPSFVMLRPRTLENRSIKCPTPKIALKVQVQGEEIKGQGHSVT